MPIGAYTILINTFNGRRCNDRCPRRRGIGTILIERSPQFRLKLKKLKKLKKCFLVLVYFYWEISLNFELWTVELSDRFRFSALPLEVIQWKSSTFSFEISILFFFFCSLLGFDWKRLNYEHELTSFAIDFVFCRFIIKLLSNSNEMEIIPWLYQCYLWCCQSVIVYHVEICLYCNNKLEHDWWFPSTLGQYFVGANKLQPNFRAVSSNPYTVSIPSKFVFIYLFFFVL